MRRSLSPSLSPVSTSVGFFLCAALVFASYLHDGSPRRAVQAIHPLAPTLLKTVPDIAYVPASVAGEFPAQTHVAVRVVSVHDGDTVSVVRVGYEQAPSTTVRLAAIDAPELSQPGGEESRAALALLLRRNIPLFLYVRERDRYGRLVGWLFADKECLNLTMIARGHAWHFSRYDSDPAYAYAQARAQDQRLGLWQQPNPVPPWVWRKKAPAS